ncbi:hypothetical protein [Calothrix sp. PCC 7507]|uniref:competence protein CoiA family protein n=1 Tax=Calothrix sp. PCC 7507 TaxID=99598 RepID=UPI00029F14DA|nr:hypothetical protein [Calothrix sp. PCC 7507]AFY32084.1 hypothetical protein Cal7507_1626 [Calothrix sp. PCC 7507]
MEYARAMALGGQKVYADNCNFSSYDELKLRCYVCGEPVYLKKGEYRKPHFAHFHVTSSRQVEECNLRVSADGNGTKTSSLVENRGQRLEIFQQHFLSMISVDQEKVINNIKSNSWIDSIKRDNNQAINNIIKDCSQYFLTHYRLMEDKYILPLAKIKDKQILLQQQIALEAIDYLCIKSSAKLLEYLIYYSIFKLYEHEQYKLFKREFTTKDIDNICHFAIKIIISNNWIEVFENIIKINKSNSIPVNSDNLTKDTSSNYQDGLEIQIPETPVKPVTPKQEQIELVNGGYIGNPKGVKTKRSIGVKLPTGIQKNLDVTIVSRVFICSELKHLGKLQLRLTDTNSILLINSQNRIVGTVAYISGYKHQMMITPLNPNGSKTTVTIFNWDFNSDFKFPTEQLRPHVNRLLEECNKSIVKYKENREKAELTAEQRKKKAIISSFQRK